MAKGDTVLVTGARGFIAKHCIAELLERGYRVRGTVRKLDDAEEVRAAVRKRVEPGDRLAFAVADLTLDDGWTEAVQGCRYVLHVASPYPMVEPKARDQVVRPAREGTKRVLAAARAAGVERVVLTSSVAAVAFGRTDKTRFDESDWSDINAPLIRSYQVSKTLAERAAWDFVKGGGPQLAVINAGQVFGPPLDGNAQTSGKIIGQFLNGGYRVVARFGFPIADVRDVATAHVLAMESPKAAGERFIVADAFLWLTDMGKIIGEAFPAYRDKMPRTVLPDGVARFLGLFRADLKMVRGDINRLWEVDSTKARTVLGLKIRPAREAVIAMADVLIRNGRS